MSYIPKEKQYDNLYNAFKIASENKKIFFEFLEDILTPRELHDLIIRLEIVDRLYNYQQHRAVADDLSVGIGTVTRGANELKNKNGGFHKILAKIHKK